MSENDKYRLRRAFIWIHRYVGLFIGLVVVVLGLSGSIIVYWREIDAVFNPEERVVYEPGRPMISLDAVLASVKRAHPQRPKPWTLEMPHGEGAPYYATYSRPEERGLKYSTNLHVAVHPYTGEILRTWYWGETPLSWIYDVHANLQAGLFGHEVVGAFGVVLLFISLSGLYVWWPYGSFRKRHFLVKTDGGTPRLELDLHRAGGFYSMPLMIIFAVTGYMFVYPAHLQAVVAKVSTLGQVTPMSLHGGDETHGTSSGEHKHDDPRYPESMPRGLPSMSVTEAVTRALAVFPGSEVKRIYTPAGEKGVYGVILRHPVERLNKSYPVTEVWMDQFDGRVIVKSDPSRNSAGQDFLDAALPLHNGEAAGGLGRALVCIAGLVPTLLFITGTLQWLRRRRRNTATETATA